MTENKMRIVTRTEYLCGCSREFTECKYFSSDPADSHKCFHWVKQYCLSIHAKEDIERIAGITEQQ